MQTVIVLAIIILAVGYLAGRVYTTFRSARDADGCGAGCGCEPTAHTRH